MTFSKRKQVIFYVFSIWFCATIYMVRFLEESQKAHSIGTNKFMDSHHHYSSVKGVNEGCEIPQLNPFSREIMQFLYAGEKIECNGKDWVKCYFSGCRVVPELLTSMRNNINQLECTYRDILFKNDKEYYFGPPSILKGNQEYTLSKSDHVEISCNFKGSGPFNFSNTTSWSGHGVGFRQIETENFTETNKSNSFNVLILGIDSASKNGFIRRMPKSYKYLKKLGAVVLNGYNIVGDGTPASLFPILTGKTEPELPYCGKDGNQYLDDTDSFIFNKVKKVGYRTAYFEDCPRIGTFQYRFNGFRHSPTDHYGRPFFLEAENLYNKNKDNRYEIPYCVGDTPRFKLMMNITDQFFNLTGKKFIFTFISDISHDNFDNVFNADRPLKEFLERFWNKGWFNNTLLIVMGDHGSRISELRNTYQGRIEERLPFMAIRLPDDLTSKRTEAHINLKSNVNALTSPHDIYATILDVINMTNHWNDYKVTGSNLTRGMTLLNPIVPKRSCTDAGISPYWCVCTQWSKVQTDDPLYNRTAQALVDHINRLTDFLRSKCVLRTLSSIEWEMKMHGMVTKGNVSELVKIYQVKISVLPKQADFEAAVIYYIKEDKFHVNTREISRTNGYHTEPHCITTIYPRLNPYCYCKIPLRTFL